MNTQQPVRYRDFYLVYPDGRVYSEISNKFLKESITWNGYYVLGSNLGYVHRLVVTCFIGEIPDHLVVNHKNGIKTDNRVENLEIVTRSQNIIHAYATGLAEGKAGEDNSQAKLTEQQVLQMYIHLKAGVNNETLGNMYNVHPRYISLIRHGHRWGHLYSLHGPFPESITVDPFQEKRAYFEANKDTMTNKQIANHLSVDPSTVSRWRSRGI